MLEWIMAFVKLCETAIATGKALQAIQEDQITVKERELLRSAADDGLFHLSYGDLTGKCVWTSTKQFTKDDPAVTAAYLDAFMRLCDRGLIVHQHAELFRLTGQGFEIARRLQSGKRAPDSP